MAAVTPLTTRNEIEQEIGADGMREWTDHDRLGTEVTKHINRAIDRATSEIMRTAGQRYSAAGMSANDEIRAWATILACFFLSKSRAMHPPDSLMEDVDYIREQLKAISKGDQTLPGVSLKSDLSPTITNRIIDRRFTYRTVRKRPDSTGPPSTRREDDVIDQ